MQRGGCLTEGTRSYWHAAVLAHTLRPAAGRSDCRWLGGDASTTPGCFLWSARSASGVPHAEREDHIGTDPLPDRHPVGPPLYVAAARPSVGPHSAHHAFQRQIRYGRASRPPRGPSSPCSSPGGLPNRQARSTFSLGTDLAARRVRPGCQCDQEPRLPKARSPGELCQTLVH